MQVVRRLVGLDTDERRLHPVHGAEPLLEVDVVERLREGVLQLREEEAPERAAAPDQVFPEAALRLVHAERRRRGERRALQLTRDAVLVEPVSAFVHRREEAVEVVSW